MEDLFEIEPIFFIIGLIGILNCIKIIFKTLFFKETYSIEEQNLLNKLKKEKEC